MIGANKKKSDFATPYTVSNALTKGGAAVKLSAVSYTHLTLPTN